MNGKRVLPFFLLILMVSAGTFADGFDLGLGYTPMPRESEEGVDQEFDFREDGLLNIHLGYKFLGIFYASVDSFLMPPHMIEGMTGEYIESQDGSEGFWKEGFYRPGFLNMFDAGIRFDLGSLLLGAQVGFNNLYIYRQDKDDLNVDSDFGANIRLLAGYSPGFWGVLLTATSVQPTFKAVVQTLKGIASKDEYLRQKSTEQLVSTLVPSLVFFISF